MRRKVVYCGLDVGSRTFHLVAMNAGGKVLEDRKFDTSETNLVDAFKAVAGELHVHLEASELAGWVRGVLQQKARSVERVCVSHAKTNAWIAKDPHKSDKVDAFKLADLLRMGRIHEVYYPDEERRTLFKKVVRHYDDMTQQQARLKRKIKARLRAHGVIVRGKRLYSRTGREEVIAGIGSDAAREVIVQLYELLDHTVEMQQKALKLMRQESRRYTEVARFKDVPGVSLRLACRFCAYIQTPYRFSSKRKLWRYCQLGVTDRSSDGKSLGRRKLDGNGNSRLKDLSHTAFISSRRTLSDNAFKRAYRRSLRGTHNPVHARLSTQRKILTTLWTMWKKGEKYQDDRG